MSLLKKRVVEQKKRREPVFLLRFGTKSDPDEPPIELACIRKFTLVADYFTGCLFGNLSRLEIKNSIIPLLKRCLLAGLGRLEELNLSCNEIRFIARDSFTDLTNLHTLNLAYNQLRAVSVNTLEHIGVSIASV